MTYEPETADDCAEMVGMIFLLDAETADRAGLMADTNCRLLLWLLNGLKDKARSSNAMEGIDCRRNITVAQKKQNNDGSCVCEKKVRVFVAIALQFFLCEGCVSYCFYLF